MRKTVQFLIPASVTYDDQNGTAEAAVDDFYRSLAEAEQAGFMDRTHIEMSYGRPSYMSAPRDADPEPGYEDKDCGQEAGS